MRKFLLLLIPVALLLGWLYLRGAGPAEIPFIRVVRETIVSTLNTNGKVEPIEWAAAHAEVGGPIERVEVQRGQVVHKGQLLITVAGPDAQTQLSTSQARIEAARADIETLNHGGRASELAEIESGLIRGRWNWQAHRRSMRPCNASLPRMPRPKQMWKQHGAP